MQEAIKGILPEMEPFLRAMDDMTSEKMKELTRIPYELRMCNVLTCDRMLGIIRHEDAAAGMEGYDDFQGNEYLKLYVELDEALECPDYYKLNGAFQLVELYTEIEWWISANRVLYEDAQGTEKKNDRKITEEESLYNSLLGLLGNGVVTRQEIEEQLDTFFPNDANRQISYLEYIKGHIPGSSVDGVMAKVEQEKKKHTPVMGLDLPGNVVEGKQSSSNNGSDILLRGIFGEHLTDFLSEAIQCKKGSDVARLVNWYVRKYNLRENLGKKGDLNKPLWEALQTKGIETASISTWNNTIK